MLMNDDWFGHRNLITGETQGDKTEWTFWDFHLAQVVQLIEDFTNQYGMFEWEVEDDKNRTTVVTEFKIDKVRQAIEIAESSSQNKKRLEQVKGSYMSPRLTKRSAEWPDHVEYFERMADKYPDED